MEIICGISQRCCHGDLWRICSLGCWSQGNVEYGATRHTMSLVAAVALVANLICHSSFQTRKDDVN